MALLGLLPFVFYAFIQTAPGPLFQGDVLNAEEKTQLGRAQTTDDRIKVYYSASKRMQQWMHVSVSGNDFSKAPDILEQWGELLSGSLKDIEANLTTKKKSKPLIKYEIEVRKAITAFKAYKTNAPLDQQDLFDSKLADAETIRKRLVEIIFQ
jgi:hypothetical protein